MTEDDLAQSVAREWKRDREDARANEGASSGDDAALRAKIVDAAALALGPAPAKQKASNVRWLGWAAPPIVLAAGIALYVGTQGPEYPPLPQYLPTWGGDRIARSDDDPPVVRPSGALQLSPTGRADLVFRPSAPVTGPLEAHGALMRGNDVRAWNPPFQISPEGAVRVAGPSRQVFDMPPGEWTAIVALGRPGEVPKDPQRIVAGPGSDLSTWQTFWRQVAFKALE